MPAVHVTGGDDDLGVRVGFNELFREGHTWPVADGLAVSEQLIPLLAAEGAHAVVLRRESVRPHQAVWWVLDRGRHHVIAVFEPQLDERCAEGRCSRPSQAEGEHSHGNDAAAFSSIDVGLVGGEDVRRGLGRVWLESHCEGNSRSTKFKRSPNSTIAVGETVVHNERMANEFHAADNEVRAVKK